jgi:hypothetical protein
MIKSTPLSHLPAASLSPRSEMGTNMSLEDSQARRIANILEQLRSISAGGSVFAARGLYSARQANDRLRR